MIITICIDDNVLDAVARQYDAPEKVVVRQLHELLALVKGDDSQAADLVLSMLKFLGKGPGLMDYNGDIE